MADQVTLAGDLKVYNDEFQSGFMEGALRVIQLFNGATRGAITLKNLFQKGNISTQAFWKGIDAISRRDKDTQTSVDSIKLEQDEMNKFKVYRRFGPVATSLTAFDAVKAYGGNPANYCEIGGNPSVFKVKELTRHILSKAGVEKILVIMNVLSNTRVDLVARGVIKGVLEAGKKPSETIAIFRVPGAWEQEGFKILSRYGVHYCDRTVSIDEASKIAVEKMTILPINQKL